MAASDVVQRAQAWRNGAHAAICDVIEPWAHGTVVLATRYPSYFAFNLVRVEDDPQMGVEELVRLADETLAGFAHRRLDFDRIDVAEPLRAGFEAIGWKYLRILWMRHDGASPDPPEAPVEEVPYDAVNDLRETWHDEDSSGGDQDAFHRQAREVALRRGARVLAMRKGGEPVAYAQLERDGRAAEITQVYVHPDHRGAGRGTAMTRAAIAAARDATDLWIAADDEDRPKRLYARLGFRPVWTMVECTRSPKAESSEGVTT